MEDIQKSNSFQSVQRKNMQVKTFKEKSSPCTGASWSGTARLYAVYAHSIEAELRGVAAIHDAQANKNMQVITFANERL